MQLYKVSINPTANFATLLKGDTLFGQMCWAIRYAFGEQRLEELLSDYEENPFLVVSDGFPVGYLPKPSLPSSLLGEESEKKKENRKKRWLRIDELQSGAFANAREDKDVGNLHKEIATIKNSINYLTFRTDDSGTFAPYAEKEMTISKRDIYLLCRDDFSKESLQKALQLVGDMGYGKNSTIGKGFFEIESIERCDFSKESTTYMTLSPLCAENMECKNLYGEPFTRFGRHGAELANKNPFKKPLLLLNSRSVVQFESPTKKTYIGRAIKEHSTHKKTVHQGYAIVIPIKEIE